MDSRKSLDPNVAGTGSTGNDIPLPEDTANPTLSKPIPKMQPSTKGVENAKKRLRAFSIQKKTPITPLLVPKATGSGNTTVLIGKLSGVKAIPKPEPDPEQKKLPKPPKPGTTRKSFQDSYTDLQKRTLAEIEDMKRKMELVDLGIPLGLICPSSTSEKAMPTKAMPPIKSFLDPSKVDELIREAKKARQEGKEFKFDYQKLLPDYDNPFQRKKDESSHDKDRKSDRRKSDNDKDRRKSDKYESRRSEYRKDDKYRERSEKSRDKTRKVEEKSQLSKTDKGKETDVNLNDYLVCDSWSIDNEDKNNSSSPKTHEKTVVAKVTEPTEQLKASVAKQKDILKSISLESPRPTKIEKLQPVMDTFKYEIDPTDDDIIDIFDKDSGIEKYAQQTKVKKLTLYDSPDKFDENLSKDADENIDDTFLESVLNELKQEGLNEDESQDKGLVEYEMSPKDNSKKKQEGSVTPELIEKRDASQTSDYSDDFRSDCFKTPDTSESGYKSDGFRLSIEKELDDALEAKMSRSTVDSLETWNFVLRICQPLLFRHDKNKCYKETRAAPKIWYTVNPRSCACVKDRKIVYEELERCKTKLVDRVYGCDQIPESRFPQARTWYPSQGLIPEASPLPLSNEWEAEDSQPRTERDLTPEREDLSLDREYQRFMKAVWPDVVDKVDTSRSTTPVQQEARKKKVEKEAEDKKVKKIKLSSEGWSQESDIEEEDKRKQAKEKTKIRKRKHSTSSSSSSSKDDDDLRKERKILKKKALKKTKSKSAKRRRIGRKMLKKLKEKQKKKRRLSSDGDSDSNRTKRLKKKKMEKKKLKAQKKKKKVESSSSSSSSDSSSDSSESYRRTKKKNKQSAKKKNSKRQRKQSSSDSSQSEIFDVNILNNIKTERLTDDEKGKKLMEFSPRRQKPREIINVKELQNDFVEKVHIKQEKVEKAKQSQGESDDKEKDVAEVKDDENVVQSPVTVEQNVEQNSQESGSVSSVKDAPIYEKDESHLRPSSQNSNYSFNDVIASQNTLYSKGIETVTACEGNVDNYDGTNYEMYEQMAMQYQNDVASQEASPQVECSQRIETVVRARCGEIKCDWRPPACPPQRWTDRPSRWGLKPGEVNIVLTGGSTEPPTQPEPVYHIQSLANRTDNTGYDEAYLDMYGASDRLQYGDCFATENNTNTKSANIPIVTNTEIKTTSSLDARIDKALRETVLGEVAKELEADTDKEAPEKGILMTAIPESRGNKRVRFADGYTPGQDSDVEDPPVKKKKRRRTGCPWPCPASHPDHVSLWDALPPPPPPPGSPPPPPRHTPSLQLLRTTRQPLLLPPVPSPLVKYDPSVPLPGFMPPEPPPGLITLQ